jgi:ubiquinone/menaquinone biosynthesis C-methylase UbiE
VAALWSGASYERIAATFTPIHERVVQALRVVPGQSFLDLACGTGGVAFIAARAGAEVVGLDISDDQLEKARYAASEEGLAVRFDEGDCQALPYAEGEFDVVASVFGFVFASDHSRAAAELARVCRRGGRISFTAWGEDDWSRLGERLGRWNPEGDDSREWGREEYVRTLLGEEFELRFEHGEYVVPGTPKELWELLSTSAPPLKAWLDTLDSDRYEVAMEAHLEFLVTGEFRRDFLLVLGERR